MKIPLRLAFILCLSPQIVSMAQAQENERFQLSADSLSRHGRIWLDRNWKYHAGDQSEWRQPDFDDRHWEIADTRLESSNFPKSGWQGVGWFRIHLAVDSTLWQQPLILTMSQAGAAEIYLDGKAIYEFGDDGLNPQKEKSGPYRDFVSLIYRAAAKQVEELELKGMPLGIFAEFPYKVEEVKLNAGDTILLMSDGLPEMFNDHGEILDYPTAKNLFAEVADKSPQEIIAHLNKAGEAWANGRPQEDDVTFVVMKVK